MPVWRHKNRVMFDFFKFKKKHIRYPEENDYPIGMDTMPTVMFGNKNIISKTGLSKRIGKGRPKYRPIKKGRDSKHLLNF